METQLLGMAIVCLSGVAGGCFAFPLRTRRLYQEENTLLGAYLLAIVVIPAMTASLLFPGWPRIFAGAAPLQLLVPFLCGIGWGFGAYSYAQGVARIGIALTVSIVMGLTMSIGAIIPLAAKWSSAGAPVRAAILGGIAVCAAGVVLFGAAGRLRERHAPTPAGTFAAGFLWSVGCGLLSPLANIGFTTGAPFVERAVQLGGDPRFAAMFGWFPSWCGGLVTLLVVLGGRMLRRGTWRLYTARGSRGDLLRTAAMGALHFLGQVPYGIGALLLGTFGTSIGWAATLGTQLLAANGLGVLMGEWKGAPRAGRAAAVLGLLAVLCAVALLAWASVLAA